MAAAPPPGSDRCPLLQMGKVLLAEASVRLGTRRQRFGQSHGDACFVAREDLRAVEVVAIGSHVSVLRTAFACLAIWRVVPDLSR